MGRNKKIYVQKFRQEWIALFKPWLIRDPNSPDKPFCKVCQCHLNCNICHFQRHSRTVKHRAHLEAIKNGGDLFELKHKLSQRPISMKNQKIIEARKKSYLEKNKKKPKKVIQSEDLPNTNYQFEPESETDCAVDCKISIHSEPITQLTSDLSLPNQTETETIDRAKILDRINKDRIDFFGSYATVLSQREQLLRSSKFDRDHIDLYFDSVSASIKRLSPKLVAEAKLRVSQMVAELEIREITAKEGATTANESAASSSPQLTATGIENPESLFYVHHPNLVYVGRSQNENSSQTPTSTTAYGTPS